MRHDIDVTGGGDRQRYDELVSSIYDERYAAEYPALYIAPWPRKHELNATNLSRILAALGPGQPSWLDIGCGQAWHFSMFPGRARGIGLDLSHAQLMRAKRNVPGADFVCADMVRAPLSAASFDLVTNFWAGYCYLGTCERIGRLLRDITRWIRPGGALYLEVLLARDLESFNRSHFADATGFTVVPRSADYTAWSYFDTGGWHVMMSPPLEFFIDILTPQFEKIETNHDGAFIVHLVATERIG
jgi:ubiquinone/menaquinone biosynthesis C-methylase UbiE